jgi:hypothetical protein
MNRSEWSEQVRIGPFRIRVSRSEWSGVSSRDTGSDQPSDHLSNSPKESVTKKIAAALVGAAAGKRSAIRDRPSLAAAAAYAAARGFLRVDFTGIALNLRSRDSSRLKSMTFDIDQRIWNPVVALLRSLICPSSPCEIAFREAQRSRVLDGLHPQTIPGVR